MTASDPGAGGTPDAIVPPSQTPQRWRQLLFASLAINLLFAGAAAGSLLTWKRHHGSGGKSQDGKELAITGFIKSLPKERAKELRRLIKQQKVPDFDPLMENARQARRNAADVLAAETFSKDKLTAAFAGIEAAEGTMKSTARALLIDVAEHLTQAERQALADRWKSRKPHMFEDTRAAKKTKSAKEPSP